MKKPNGKCRLISKLPFCLHEWLKITMLVFLGLKWMKVLGG